MTRQLFHSAEARADLDLFDFIALDNPRRARSYIDDIRAACLNLCETPFIGMRRPDLRNGVRVLPLWRRIILACMLPPNRVDSLRVFSGGRDYQSSLG